MLCITAVWISGDIDALHQLSLVITFEGSAMFYRKSCGTGSETKLCADYINNPNGLVQEMKKVQMDIHGSGPIPVRGILRIYLLMI